MKKASIFVISFFLIFLLNASVTEATVGGPTLIHSIQYSTTQPLKVVYEAQNYNGKGCPPEVFSLNLITNAIQTLVDCDDVDWDLAHNGYDAKLEYTLAQYPTLLKHIDLAKNKITANIAVVGEERINSQAGFFGRTDYRLDIFQNGEKKDSFSYSGCSADQPHIIEGYAFPKSNNLILLVSSIGDCFEGGYIAEKLYSVPNVTITDLTSLPLKGNKEASAGPGNIYLIAKKSAVAQPTNTIQPSQSPSITNVQPTVVGSTDMNSNLSYMIIIGALVVIILVLIIRRR